MKKTSLNNILIILFLILLTANPVLAAESQLKAETGAVLSDIEEVENTEINIKIDTKTDGDTHAAERPVQDTNTIESVNENLNAEDKNLIGNLLQSRKELFGTVLDNIDNHEIQILYTQINRDENQKPSFKSYEYRIDSKKYFYPGSSVKLSACVLALEKLNNLGIKGLGKYTYLKVGADYAGQTTASGTIADYIKRILISSDNYSFNRLYEFLGQKYYNQTLWNKGYHNVKIVHRLAQSLSSEANRHTNPFTFYKDSKVIYQQSSAYNEENYNQKLDQEGFIKGTGINTINFSENNYISIKDLQGILKAIIFKWETPASQRFNLSDDDYIFLQKYLAATPRQAGYDFPASTRVYRKSGYAWGYMISNAYIIDTQNNVEFLLTAVIHDGAFDNYNDYGRVNRPFLANLGKVIYEHEKSRKVK